MNFILAVFFLSSILFVVDAGFQRCEEISVSASDYSHSDYNQDKWNLSFSVILHVSRSSNDNQNIITVKQFTQHDSQNLHNLETGMNYTLCADDQCFNNINDSVIVDDTLISISALDARYPSDLQPDYLIFWGSINDANFAFYDGRMFNDEENKCLAYPDIDKDLLFNLPFLKIETCCTSFQPVTIVPESTPKCTKFNLVSTIFNDTENIFIANTNADFLVSESKITGTGKSSISYSPFEMAFGYAINSLPCQWSSTNFQYCYYPINGEDKILWFYVRQEPGTYPLALAGKLIIRDGQTLSAEGIAFSTTNICQNFSTPLIISDPFGDSLNRTVNVLSQFCCASFQNISPSPSTFFPTSNITEQKCNLIQTSSTFGTLNLNMSANLEVSSLNDTNNLITVNNFEIDTPLDMSKFEFCTNEFVNDGENNCRPILSSMNFSVQNSLLQLIVKTKLNNDNGEPYTPLLFYGIIDHGSFISYDGSLFDMDKQKCSIFNENTLSVMSCCAAFNQIRTMHTIVPPRCSNFRASSTLYNANDNSVYAMASANFMFTNTDLIGIGDFSAASVPLYSINTFRFQFGVNGTQFGGFPISSNSSEFLIHLSYFEDYKQVFVGRIILFEGQTFMDQNMPFSPSNACYNFTAPYYDIKDNNDINVVSQFCCTNFGDSEGNTTPAATTLSTESTTSNFAIRGKSLRAILFMTALLFFFNL